MSVRRQLDTLALDAAQHGVDEAVTWAGLGQLDGLADGGVGGHAVEEHELEEPELQGGAHARLEVTVDVGGDDVVERQASLDRPEGQLLGQRAVARIEAAGLAVQRAVGVGAARSACAARRRARRGERG